MNKIILASLTILTISISAMDSMSDWEQIIITKKGLLLEGQREASVCHEIGRQIPGFFSTIKNELEKSQATLAIYEQDISRYKDEALKKSKNTEELKEFATGRITYMQQLLEKIKSIRELLQTNIPAQQIASKAGQQQQSLVNQILSTHEKPITSLAIGKSIPLTLGTEIIGFARAYPQGIVIELKGQSQEQNMACGYATYSYARILETVHSYPELLHALRNPVLIERYGKELRTAFFEKNTPIFGPIAQSMWDDMMQTNGLSPDYLYTLAHAKNLFVCADDATLFNAFPSPEQAQKLRAQKKQEWLRYTFFPDTKRFDPQAEIQPFTLPSTGLLLTGQNIEKIGHWVAVHFEKIIGNKIGIIFADSCPYARDGGKMEAVDKIETYNNMFTKWFTTMPQATHTAPAPGPTTSGAAAAAATPAPAPRQTPAVIAPKTTPAVTASAAYQQTTIKIQQAAKSLNQAALSNNAPAIQKILTETIPALFTEANRCSEDKKRDLLQELSDLRAMAQVLLAQ